MKQLKQCGSCEHIFKNFKGKDRVCPRCFSGNWVYGYIDDYIQENPEGFKDFIINAEDIEVYGDDGRAIIRAFADKLALSCRPMEELNDKANLEFLRDEINFILEYEL